MYNSCNLNTKTLIKCSHDEPVILVRSSRHVSHFSVLFCYLMDRTSGVGTVRFGRFGNALSLPPISLESL